ncbi:hypothetical protein HDU97_008855 [Phlyctochytrium planicorne]|nr:hypothetical protein HDU97_008855 [Phlyctochytrium planicorne]
MDVLAAVTLDPIPTTFDNYSALSAADSSHTIFDSVSSDASTFHPLVQESPFVAPRCVAQVPIWTHQQTFETNAQRDNCILKPDESSAFCQHPHLSPAEIAFFLYLVVATAECHSPIILDGIPTTLASPDDSSNSRLCPSRFLVPHALNHQQHENPGHQVAHSASATLPEISNLLNIDSDTSNFPPNRPIHTSAPCPPPSLISGLANGCNAVCTAVQEPNVFIKTEDAGYQAPNIWYGAPVMLDAVIPAAQAGPMVAPSTIVPISNAATFPLSNTPRVNSGAYISFPFGLVSVQPEWIPAPFESVIVPGQISEWSSFYDSINGLGTVDICEPGCPCISYQLPKALPDRTAEMPLLQDLASSSAPLNSTSVSSQTMIADMDSTNPLADSSGMDICVPDSMMAQESLLDLLFDADASKILARAQYDSFCAFKQEPTFPESLSLQGSVPQFLTPQVTDMVETEVKAKASTTGITAPMKKSKYKPKRTTPHDPTIHRPRNAWLQYLMWVKKERLRDPVAFPKKAFEQRSAEFKDLSAEKRKKFEEMAEEEARIFKENKKRRRDEEKKLKTEGSS